MKKDNKNGYIATEYEMKLENIKYALNKISHKERPDTADIELINNILPYFIANKLI